nr:hypothetical protein [Tanacetum cinerariifolium]
MASASPICLMARASSTKSWLWHQRLSYLNFNTINDLARNDLVSGLPKFKYHKEQLCPSCEQRKRKRASHLPKPAPNSRQRLHLLHMDLCGPMRIASINGKQTNNGTEFKNQVLKEYFDSVGISHQMSSVRTPQQNRVVERQNQTLVEAARTMLVFSRAPLFLWAEAIATACFTQNRSIIHRCFNKTPYELINGRKPDISFLHVFGALFYPKNDREDIEKLGAKDLGPKAQDETKYAFDITVKVTNVISIMNLRVAFHAINARRLPIAPLVYTLVKPYMTTPSANNSVFRGFFEKQKLNGPNFIDSYRQLRIILSIEDKLNYLEQPIPSAPIKGQSVSSYVLKMKGYIDNLERLGNLVILGLGVSLILIDLRKEYDGFVQNYDMHSMGKTVNELHAMLKIYEKTLPKNNAPALHVILASKVQKHKHDVFETFKVFQKEVENQLGKTIKSLRSNCGGEYMSQEFLDHLKDHEMAHRTPPYISQHNGMSERRNKTLLNMVRSMMSQTIPKSFLDYELETAASILNMVPTKKFEHTPYKNAKFLENSLITQEASGSLKDLEIIQEEDTHPSIDTSLNHKKDDLEIDEPQSDIIPIRRFTRTRHAPDRMYLYINGEEHELGDLSEPSNYKAELLDPESEKWLNAMNVEMQSMKDNEVWLLVELPPTGDLHWTTVKNILKYLRNINDMFLVYEGYVFILNSGAVDWKTAKQRNFATSSAEAEYIAAFDASNEALWVRKFIFGLSVVPTIEEPI